MLLIYAISFVQPSSNILGFVISSMPTSAYNFGRSRPQGQLLAMSVKATVTVMTGNEET